MALIYSGCAPTCNICSKSFGDVMWDGATVYGPWANMCDPCHKRVGRGSGVGRGQKYALVDGKWVKQ